MMLYVHDVHEASLCIAIIEFSLSSRSPLRKTRFLVSYFLYAFSNKEESASLKEEAKKHNLRWELDHLFCFFSFPFQINHTSHCNFQLTSSTTSNHHLHMF